MALNVLKALKDKLAPQGNFFSLVLYSFGSLLMCMICILKWDQSFKASTAALKIQSYEDEVDVIQNHRITELKRLQGTSRDHWVQPFWQSRFPRVNCPSRLPESLSGTQLCLNLYLEYKTFYAFRVFYIKAAGLDIFSSVISEGLLKCYKHLIGRSSKRVILSRS